MKKTKINKSILLNPIKDVSIKHDLTEIKQYKHSLIFSSIIIKQLCRHQKIEKINESKEVFEKLKENKPITAKNLSNKALFNQQFMDWSNEAKMKMLK